MHFTDTIPRAFLHYKGGKKGGSSPPPSRCHATVTRLKPSRLLDRSPAQKTQREVFLPLFIRREVVCFTKEKIARNLSWKRERSHTSGGCSAALGNGDIPPQQISVCDSIRRRGTISESDLGELLQIIYSEWTAL